MGASVLWQRPVYIMLYYPLPSLQDMVLDTFRHVSVPSNCHLHTGISLCTFVGDARAALAMQRR